MPSKLYTAAALICLQLYTFVVVLVVVIFGTNSSTVGATAFCSSSNNEQLHATFTTTILPNEYLVTFKNYYWSRTRQKYIKSALKKLNNNYNITTRISGIHWDILPRHNVANKYPSDFDVLYLHAIKIELRKEVLNKLLKHPAIKSLTEHRSVIRNLQYIQANNLTETQYSSYVSYRVRNLLRAIPPKQIAAAVQADILWQHGIRGQGIKVAIFDTGLTRKHPHFRVVKERTNWTNEKSLNDGVSHGTFVAGVIASSKECFGLAPDAELHIYRVFTNNQVSYTSWFLDAFNYAIFKRINILNLSIGGPDFLDRPFVDKVLELSANRIIMVSAIGNDGPQYGTLNNPGDQSDVIGVGGINFDEHVAKFSSRGMTTWELPQGYGRLKPDIVTYGSQVSGSNVRGGCRTLSGTSVAAPVIAGAIAVLSSGVPQKANLLNPASMKQVLLEGATRLPENNMFEQGHGKLNLLQSMQLLVNYEPKVSLSPAYVDFTEPYMWPYSAQALYCDSIPIIINVTILNGYSVMGRIIEMPQWHAYSDQNGNLLNVAIDYAEILWPWSGWMAVHLGVNKHGCEYVGEARGYISLLVQPDMHQKHIISRVFLPITVRIIAKPPRHKRLLWDQYHSLRYPPGYLPRDNLKVKSDPLDWRADHIHTNFRDTFMHLRSRGYYIDVLREPLTCFNATDYNTLLIVDAEEEFHAEEITKLQYDVYDRGLSVVVIADWYNASVMQRIKFFDENTRQWWIPDTGGANIPALNELLQPYGVAFGDIVAEDYFKWGDHEMYYASGVNIARFPKEKGNLLLSAKLHDQGRDLLSNGKSTKSNSEKMLLPILGLVQAKRAHKRRYLQSSTKWAANSQVNSYEDLMTGIDVETPVTRQNNPILNKRILLEMQAENEIVDNSINSEEIVRMPALALPLNMPTTKTVEGRIAVYGDSNCLDSTYLEKPCFWLLDAILSFTTQSYRSKLLQQLNQLPNNVPNENTLPLRLSSSNLHKYSKILDENNKYKQRALQACNNIAWQTPIFINSNASEVPFAPSRPRSYNHHNDPLMAHDQVVDLSFLGRVGASQLQAAVNLSAINNVEDILESTIMRPMIFVYLLTFIVLGILLHYFKCRRRLRFIRI